MRARATIAALWFVASCAVAQTTSVAPMPADEADALGAWRDNRAVVLMRHALAPGVGDPADFDVGDCATQRNLSVEGRAQARAIGARLREALGDGEADVLSSAWCRCLETARLLDIGDVEPLAPLNSFFRERDRAEAATAALDAWIGARLDGDAAAPAVLVTHQVNVTALTGRGVASGEMLVLGRDADGAGYVVLAAIGTPSGG